MKKRSEYSGVCTYCGFGLVTAGPRACCLAGRDVDAVERDLAAANERAERYREALEEIKDTHEGYCENHIGVSEHSYGLYGIACAALQQSQETGA